MRNDPDEINNTKRPVRRDFFYWIGRLFLFLIILFFGVLILIQLPPVQLWGARKLSNSISKTLNTTVSIGGFNLHPISDLSLTDVFIGSPDYPSDTLIRAHTINVDFLRLWDLYYNKLTINQIVIDDALLNIEKKAGDTLTNLDLAMLKLTPTKARDTSKAAFLLDLEKISATNLHVKINDNTKGSLLRMVMDRAEIALDTLDMVGQYFSAEYMDFDNPLIYISQKVTEPVVPSSVTKEDKSWSFDIGDLKWTDGRFFINNENKPYDTSQVFGMDYAHLDLVDVDIAVDSLSVRGMNIRGKNIDIHILHQNGFEIKTAAAEEAIVSSRGINFKDLQIKTADSHIRNSIEVKFNGFEDFKSFADSVFFNIPSADIRLHFKDLLALVPSLGKIRFIADNKDKTLILQGDVNGNVNKLRILNMDAKMGGLSMVGDFRSRGLAISGSQLLGLDLKKATFSAVAIKDLFPGMKVPPLLNKLGQVNFTGKFDGYPDNFVAFGNFNTALGDLTMDMNLNFVTGISSAKYSGTISMDNFNLGSFLGNPDIGHTSMTARVIQGQGLTAETINADITAVMSYIVFKGYTYRNARLDGQVSGKLFSGTMDINDPNVDMHFEGTVDYGGKTPKFDFISRIDSIRFLPLGFGDQPLAISGIFDINLTAGSFDEFSGSIQGEKVTVRIKNVDYHLDSLYVDALSDSITGDRFYNFKSNVASGIFSGTFDPVTLPNYIQQYLHSHYPSSIGPPKKVLAMNKPVRMAWDLKIHDSGPWLELAGFPGLVIKNAYTHGSLNLNEGHIIGFIELPEMHYAGINVYGSSVNFEENKGRIDGDLEVIAADLKENLFFEDVIIDGTGTDDSLRVRIKTDHIAEIIDELDVEITADPEDGNWAFSINPIKLEMLGDNWVIPPGNLIEIRRNEFNLENFELVSGDKRVVVDDINNKGIEAFITGFDVTYLNSLWITDKFEFSGLYTLDLEVDNIYDIKKLNTVLHIPAMKINNIPYGEWIFNATMNDPKDSVQLDLVMNNNEAHLTAKGAFLPPIKSIPVEKQKYLRLEVNAKEFPLDFLEFLLGGNIRDTEGSVDLVLGLKGKLDKLVPNGKGKVYNGSTTIDYLGTGYAFHDQAFTITETMIDLSGTKLYDVEGNVAIVEGGLTHRYLRDLGLNARIVSDKIIGLDVTSEENSSFYGTGIGAVNARFTGTIANMNMHIVLTTAKGTHIYIPLSGSATKTDKDFVIFLENGKLPVTRTAPLNLSGINLSMILNITKEAEIEIIFDDNTGEVLRATGEGALQIAMTRTGNLSMYGNYRIIEGDYLFTNFRVVRKPFELLPGGEIQWDGNPYDATLNVKAKYKGLSAPVYPLIQEFLVDASNETVREAARERTPVDLTMTLTGSLLHPTITFDIDFPTLTGEVRGYTESKINDLKANPNAMLQQVVGLLLTRSFLPTGLGPGVLSSGLTNTVGEYFSSALSSILSGILGDIIPEGRVLSGVDFQANIDLPTTQEAGSDFENLNTSRYGFNLPLEFFNDRLSLTVGGNYVTGATFGADGKYFAGDVTFEYDLTPDGQLSIRAYNRTSDSFEGHKNKVGLGLAYKKEYDSFLEFLGIKKKRRIEKPTEEVGGG